MGHWRRFGKAAVLGLLLAGPCLFLSASILGDEGRPAGARPDRREETLQAATDAAVFRGLRFIAKQQNEQGYWRESEYALAVSSMAGLALMGHGHPARGRFGPCLKHYTDFILKQMSREGLITRRGEQRRAYGHAFSLLFMTQIYGMLDRDRNKRLKEAILKATEFIERWQDASGCWYQDYEPGGHNQIVTVSQVQALRAANATGFRVNKRAVDRAVAFIESYSFTDSSFGRRGSSMATLLAAGRYEHPRLEEAIAVFSRDLMRNPANFKLDDLNFPIFVHMYSAQVMYFLGGEAWKSYYNKFRTTALRNLQKGGSSSAGEGWWPPFRNVHAFTPGRVYSTANICLILQMPKDYIPFYQTVKADIKGR